MMISKKILVEGFKIGGEKTYVIAEVGSNHNQNLQLAYETIDAAVECGANAVKFQSINIEELYYLPSLAIRELHRKIDLAEEWHSLLKEYSDKKGITFFSSPTYLKAVDILEETGVSLYKLASAQIGTFPQIVDKVARTGKPVIISTGIVNYRELQQVICIFQKANNTNLIILHCNSIYPTPYNKVNLGLIDIYKQMFTYLVGFSDHTNGITIPIAAVARGACVIEKHFTLSRNLPVPDAGLSLEPSEFKAMVEGIRAVEEANNLTPRTEIMSEEKTFKEAILYRLVLKKDKKKGELLHFDDFTYLRYSEGIDCREIFPNIPTYITKDLSAGSLLKPEDVVHK
ncbi:N-acetylneuraminate synthase family protein [Nostoc sp. C117]|uniref:N-acetylneuraminate synthase family protein n=1 Tax=Nostoc sp. C117 TaxID=3349875 RepID=UPI00370D7B4F